MQKDASDAVARRCWLETWLVAFDASFSKALRSDRRRVKARMQAIAMAESSLTTRIHDHGLLLIPLFIRMFVVSEV